jgi:hypothetical protein
MKVEIEKLDCVLSKRATRPYIYGHTSANAYVLIYVKIRLNAFSQTAISGHTKAEIYLCNTTVTYVPASWVSAPFDGLYEDGGLYEDMHQDQGDASHVR